MPTNGTESAAGGESRPALPITSSSMSTVSRSRSPSQLERGLSASPRSNSHYSTTPRIQLFGSAPESVPEDTDFETEDDPSERSRLLPNSVSISSASPRKSPKRHYSLSGYATTADGRPVRIEGEVNAKEVGNEREGQGRVAEEEHNNRLRNRTHSVLQVSKTAGSFSCCHTSEGDGWLRRVRTHWFE